jgi:recombination associated protein RdgC
MWFRNLLVYRLTQHVPFDPETLEAALATKPARPCASQELSTYGFVAPFGKGEDAPLVHVSQGFLLIATRKEERILPGSVVKDAVKEKVDEIEAEQMRKVYKKERDQIKDEIIQAFLPRAFIRKSGTFAAIDAERGLILVKGAVPGSKGGWVTIKDAVKKPALAEVPRPAAIRATAAAAPAAETAAEGGEA